MDTIVVVDRRSGSSVKRKDGDITAEDLELTGVRLVELDHR